MVDQLLLIGRLVFVALLYLFLFLYLYPFLHLFRCCSILNLRCSCFHLHISAGIYRCFPILLHDAFCLCNCISITV